MDPVDMEGRDDAEALSARFAALLRVERDAESNWNIDVASLLEEYLSSLPGSGVSQGDTSRSSARVNFAQAALLIQGSASVYGRKADFLHSLVLQALSLVSSAEARDEGDPDGRQRGRNGRTAQEDDLDDEATFLQLDDLPVLDDAEDGDAGLGDRQPAPPRAVPGVSSRAPSILLCLEEEPQIRAQGQHGPAKGDAAARECYEEAMRTLRFQSTYMAASSRLNSKGAVLLPTMEDGGGLGAPPDFTWSHRDSWASGAVPGASQLVSDCETMREAAASDAPNVQGHPASPGLAPDGVGGHASMEMPSPPAPLSQAEDDWDSDLGGGGEHLDDDDWGATDRPHDPGAPQVRETVELDAGHADGTKGRGEVQPEFDPYTPLDMDDVNGGVVGEGADRAQAAAAKSVPYSKGRPMLRLSRPDDEEDFLMDGAFMPWNRSMGHPFRSAEAAVQHILQLSQGGADQAHKPRGAAAAQGMQAEGMRNLSEFESAQRPADAAIAEGEGVGMAWGADAGFGAEANGWDFGGEGLVEDDDDVGGGFDGNEFGDEDGIAAAVKKLHVDLCNEGATADGAQDGLDGLHQHNERILKAAAEEQRARQSAMEKRVADWQASILPQLAVQEDRGPFDIHEYAEKILVSLESHSKVEPEAHKSGPSRPGAAPLSGDEPDLVPFQDILVEKQESFQVARFFSAMLHLVNQGNLDVLNPGVAPALGQHGSMDGSMLDVEAALMASQASVNAGIQNEAAPSRVAAGDTQGPVCHTAQCSFHVRLLSTRRTHEKFFSYRVPSAMDGSLEDGTERTEPVVDPAGEQSDELAAHLLKPQGPAKRRNGEAQQREPLRSFNRNSQQPGHVRGKARHGSVRTTRSREGRMHEGEAARVADEELLESSQVDCTPAVVCTAGSVAGES